MPLKPEDFIHKNFAGLLRKYEVYNQLKCIWWSYHPSGENRTLTTGSLLKSKGMNPGHADYIFYYKKDNECHILFIEFKAGKGKQSYNQINFENRFKGLHNVNYHLAYSESEGIQILEQYNIL
jgi:hypothetical protein